ncbi:MAG: glycosyltransferase family 39 protein [Anaerolineae bacterium]|nr:glycosyltransferase family 39 protein [Anaerolineae bacterium]
MTVRRWLAAILLVTVLGRVAFILLFDHTLSLQTSGYDIYAVNVIEGRGYTRFDDRAGDSDLPPLYPFFLIGVYKTLGRDPISVAVVQIGLDVLTALLLFWIGRRVAGEAVGLLATAFYGAYPYLLYQNLTLNDTGLFIFLLAASIAAAYRARDTRNWRWAAALGVACGLGALTKTLIVLILPLLALWWWRALGLRRAVMLGAASGIALLLVIAPWVVRNTRLHGELVLISTNSGSNLHQGNNACVADYLARGWDAQWVNCIELAPPELSETEADRWHREQALTYLREHPGEWPRLFWTKFWVLWSPVIMPYDLPPDPYLVDDAVLQFHTPAFEAARVVHALYFTPLLILGIAGLFLGWRDRRAIAPLAAVFVAITVAYLIFHPSTRYRSPADPFLFILAAYSVTRLWARIMAGRTRRWTLLRET